MVLHISCLDSCLSSLSFCVVKKVFPSQVRRGGHGGG
ncbi:hypothetical protein E2C01_085148 [Portunus trituberculatus]|uniref:Uncharacterized protein n=1 Tax=Portunus trituberculatus TaxID=210409 RepID=A0A5B7J5X0_PORTR|nr:hypothetical protein [Portunus trituberculatus]